MMSGCVLGSARRLSCLISSGSKGIIAKSRQGDEEIIKEIDKEDCFADKEGKGRRRRRGRGIRRRF